MDNQLYISTSELNVPVIRFRGFTEPWELRSFGYYGNISMCKRVMKYQTAEKGEVPFYKIGTIGAGDIKLFSLIGCYVSFMESIYCMFLAFILGAIFSLISMKQKGHFTDRISYLMSYLKESFSQKQFRYYYQDLNKFSPMEIKKTKVHLALPIFVSVCIHLGGVFL